MYPTSGTETLLVKCGQKSRCQLNVVEQSPAPVVWHRQKLHCTFWHSRNKVICRIEKQTIVSSYKGRWVKRGHPWVPISPCHIYKTML